MFPQEEAGKQERSSCSRYELDLVKNLSALGIRPGLELVHNLSALASGPESVFSNLNQEGCKDGWTYSTEHYQSTVVTEVLSYCYYIPYYCKYHLVTPANPSTACYCLD